MKLTKKFVAIVSIALALLLLSSPFSGFSDSTSIAVEASGVSTGVNVSAEYGDLLQYEWPHKFSDPQRTGFSAGPAPDRPDILWKSSDIPEIGSISGWAIAFNGKVFVESSVAGTPYLNALDPFTGEIIWQSVIPLPLGYGTSAAGGPQGPTQIDDHHIFVSAFPPQPLGRFQIAGAIICFDADDGTYLWTSPEYGSSESPGAGMYFNYLSVPELKMLYTVSNVMPERNAPVVRAFDTSDPSQPFPIAWNHSQVDEGGAEVLCYGDGKVFVGSYDGYVYALDAVSGTREWISPHIGQVGYSGTYYRGKLYVGCSSTRLTCYDGETGTIEWDYDAGGRAFFSYGGVAAYGKYYQHNIAVPDGFVAAWDAEEGDIEWTIPAYYFIGYNVPVIADGKVYVITSDGSFIAGRPAPPPTFACIDAFTGQVLWEISQTFSVPMIAYGNLYGIYGFFPATLYCFGPPKPWSMWRGNPDNPGVALGQSAPKDINYPKWQFTTGGHVVSSPAVVDGKVYVGSHDTYLYCLDARKGSLIWKFPTGYKIRSSPAVVDGRVYTGADDGYIYCIDAETGTELWKTPAGGVTGYQFQPTFQPRSSPIIVGDNLIVGALDGKVYCLNLDGTMNWTYQTESAIGGSAAVADGLAYIASTDGYLYCFNMTTGTLAWNTSIPYATFLGEICMIGTPVVAEGKVFIENGQEFFVFFGPPAPEKLFALDAYNGTIIWNATISGASPECKSPAYFNGLLYMGAEMFAAAFHASNGTLEWRQWIGHQVFSSPAYADDVRGAKLYIGTDSYAVQCLDPTKNGTALSVYTTGAQVHSSPAIWEGKMYVGSMDGNIYCFDDWRVPPVSTSITAYLSKTAINEGESVTVSGQLTPPIAYAPITVRFFRPDDTTVDLQVDTDEKGVFTISYTPDVDGQWTAWAYFDPHKEYYAYAWSEEMSLTIWPSAPSPSAPQSYAIGSVLAIAVVAAATIAIKKKPKEP